MATWTAEVTTLYIATLAIVASTRPHIAYCASLMEWLITEYNYVMGATIPNIGPLFKPHEDAIYLKLIPLLTIASQFCSTSKHELLFISFSGWFGYC